MEFQELFDAASKKDGCRVTNHVNMLGKEARERREAFESEQQKLIFRRHLPHQEHVARIAKRNSNSDSAELEANRRRYIEKQLHHIAETNRTEFLVNWLTVDEVQHEKELSRKDEKHKLELSRKDEEHRLELSRKAEEHRLELSRKAEEHRLELSRKDEEHRLKLSIEYDSKMQEALLYKAAVVARSNLEFRERQSNLYPKGRGSKPTNRQTLWVFLLSTKNAADVPEANYFRHQVLSKFCPGANRTIEQEERCIQQFGYVIQRMFGDVHRSKHGILRVFDHKISDRLMKDEKEATSLAQFLEIGYDYEEFGARALRIIVEPLPIVSALSNKPPIRTKQKDFFSYTRVAIYPKDEYEDFKDVEIENVKNLFPGLDMRSAVVNIGEHMITVDFDEPDVAMTAYCGHINWLKNTPKKAHEEPHLYELDSFDLLPLPDEEGTE